MLEKIGWKVVVVCGCQSQGRYEETMSELVSKLTYRALRPDDE